MSNEELVRNIQSGNNPGNNMELLYNQNQGFIFKIARRYSFVEDINDLMQEAYFGLYEAVNRYEDTAGVLFMTYAAFWIRQSITRYIENNGRTVRIPSGLQARALRYKKAITAYKMEFGHSPSDYEICTYLGISNDVLKDLKSAIYQYDSMQSLDETLPGTEDILLGEGIPDRSIDVENNVVNGMMDQRMKTELWQIVKERTTPEEYFVIDCRFKKSISLDATGKAIGKTGQMARQIEYSALRKLRYSKVFKSIEEKFDISYAKSYNGSLSRWKNSGQSAPESIAIKNLETELRYINFVLGYEMWRSLLTKNQIELARTNHLINNEDRASMI
jgi:RNA polymerase primary sigma factor